jgi:hypothetical protein
MADAYAEGATAAGHEIRWIDVARLDRSIRYARLAERDNDRRIGGHGAWPCLPHLDQAACGPITMPLVGSIQTS